MVLDDCSLIKRGRPPETLELAFPFGTNEELFLEEDKDCSTFACTPLPVRLAGNSEVVLCETTPLEIGGKVVLRFTAAWNPGDSLCRHLHLGLFLLK